MAEEAKDKDKDIKDIKDIKDPNDSEDIKTTENQGSDKKAPGSTGVYTSAELEKEKKKKEKAEKAKKKKESFDSKNRKSALPKNVRFECPYAPAGDSTVAFKIKEETIQLNLDNKIYTIPEKIKPENRKLLIEALKKNGFIDVTVINKAAVKSKLSGKYIYRAMHPEHTDRNPLTGNISVAIKTDDGKNIFDEDGKQVFKEIQMINGVVETEDVRVYDGLVSYGFRHMAKKDKED